MDFCLWPLAITQSLQWVLLCEGFQLNGGVPFWCLLALYDILIKSILLVCSKDHYRWPNGEVWKRSGGCELLSGVICAEGIHCWRRWVIRVVGIWFVLGTAPSHVSIPQIRMTRWPKTDKWGGKMYWETTALRTKFRGGVRVQACYAAVLIEFAIGRLGVMTTRASLLAQMGRGALTGKRACWQMT